MDECRGLFRQDQVAQLLRPINQRRVLQRVQAGRTFSYISAADARAHMNRLFGFGNWDSRTLHVEVVSAEQAPNRSGKDQWHVSALATVEVTVRNPRGEHVCTYSESAVASASLPSRGDALDMSVKGLAIDTPIPTPAGWTVMADLTVGDVVFDRDGQPCRIIDKSEVKNLPCYELLFSNGESIVCDENHLWEATIGKNTAMRTRPVQHLAAGKRAGKMITVPVALPLDLPPAQLPLDPYIFGLWLGDGCRAHPRLTADVDDIDHYEAALRTAGVEPGKRQYKRGTRGVTVTMKGLGKVLAEMGCLGEKSIPPGYLRGSVAQRRALLAGIVDSDGTVSRGRVQVTQKREHIARAVAELAASLGERPRMSSGQRSGFGVTGAYWFVEWTPAANPFTLPRKREKVGRRSKRVYNAVRSVTEIESVPTQCIAVDSPSRTYLAGTGMVPTHNSSTSDAFKRCLIALGDQFALSLYNDGSTSAIVQATLVPGYAGEAAAEEVEDVSA